MLKRKKIRERGKTRLSKYFQALNIGDRVAVVKELSERAVFPNRIQGKTGIVSGKRGRAYIVKIKDIEKEKLFIINPIHLKKII
jgi:large subunit ribosomal protein L21e